jgi:hypothetical protein
MGAGVYDITIEKRAKFCFTAKLTNSDGLTYDLTDKTLHGQIRRSFDDVLQATFTINEIDSPNAIVEFSLTKQETAALIEADSYYDIFADYDFDNTVSDKVLSGNVKIIKNCTEL